MADGNRFGWTFDTALTAICIGAFGIVTWVRTAQRGEAKAVDVALVNTKAFAADTAASTDRQFEGVRAEIKTLGEAMANNSRTVAEGFAGYTASLKLIAGLGAIVAIGLGVYSVFGG
jgi:hypothetical protein